MVHGWRVFGMRFLWNERGGMLPFTLIVMGVVILMGALAVNMVRVEHRRSVTQSVLDICILNAAAQRQTLPPRTVLDDCLDKHGFQATIADFDAQTGRTKSVTASAQTSLESFFLNRVETYDVGVSSSAAEALTNLEIILALDISASLLSPGGGSTMPFLDLKAAAKQFVATMLAEDTQGRVQITLLPYNSQVNLGADLAAKFNVSNAPQNLMIGTTQIGPDVTQKRCLELPASSFGTTTISRTQPIEASPFVDSLGTTSQSLTYVAPNNASFAVAQLQNNNCSFFRTAPAGSTANVVRLPDFTAAGQQSTVDTVQKRILALQNRIDGLFSTGETSINLGMRWALAILDPDMRPVFAEFSAAGRMSQMAANFPMDFNAPTGIKVVVLMSDGTNRTETRMPSHLARGPSPFWIGNDGNMSWFNAARSGTAKYWVPHNATWQATPWQNATNSGAAARQMDYEEVWRRMKVTYVAWHFHARSVSQASGSTNNTARQTAYLAALNTYLPAATTVTDATKDAQLTQACNLAREKGIYVYSLLFVTATTNSPTLAACATVPAMSYTATPAELQAAFAAIALHISRLQLNE